MLNINNIEWRKATRIHEVSSEGEIRNTLTGKLIKPWVSTTGYFNIKIHVEGKRKNKKLHRLVAEAFISNPEGKPYINHIDANKLNNSVSNLEWCTQLENIRHASKLGLISTKPRTTGMKLGSKSKYHNVSWDSSRNRWSACISHNKKRLMFKRFDDEIEAALHVNLIIDTYQLDRPKNVIN